MAAIKDDAPYKDFAERLIKLRTDAGLTRAQLGEKIGISGRAIINYENGTRIPYGDTCAKMAEVFGITADELLGVHNNAVDMAKAHAVDDMGRIFGNSAAKSAQTYLDGSNALLAGGTLSEEDQADFITLMRKILVDAELRAKEKYTPHTLRSPEWKANIEAKRDEVDEVVKDADEDLNNGKS